MADLNIKNGWYYAAQELVGKVDPSGTEFPASAFGNLLKTGWIPTALELANAAGMVASDLNIKNGWIPVFTEINNEVDP